MSDQTQKSYSEHYDDIANTIIAWWRQHGSDISDNQWQTAPWWQQLDALIDAANGEQPGPAISALFGGLVEVANDSLSQSGRICYGWVFSRVIWRCASSDATLSAALADNGITTWDALRTRYQQRRPGPQQSAPAQATHIVILSRVTLGADVLLNSVLIQHLQQAYPQATISLLGDGKLAGLLGGSDNLNIVPLRYARRGPLGQRLQAWLTLRDEVAALNPDLVVAADSRLDQLGLLPVSPAPYLLWENIIEGEAISLAAHLDRWCRQLWPRNDQHYPRCWPDQAGEARFHQLQTALGKRPLVAVKFDHGGNAAKSLPREAEVAALQSLIAKGWRLLIDRGFGAEELVSSDDLMQAAHLTPYDIDENDSDLGLPPDQWSPDRLQDAEVIRFHGSIAGWLAALRCCQLAISYDSVGQHLAAACRVPLHCWFTGHQHDRFPIAWQPYGSGDIHLQVIANHERQLATTWQRLIDDLPRCKLATP